MPNEEARLRLRAQLREKRAARSSSSSSEHTASSSTTQAARESAVMRMFGENAQMLSLANDLLKEGSARGVKRAVEERTRDLVLPSSALSGGKSTTETAVEQEAETEDEDEEGLPPNAT